MSEKRSALRTAALSAAVPLIITAGIVIGRWSSTPPSTADAGPGPAMPASSRDIAPSSKIKPTVHPDGDRDRDRDRDRTVPPDASRHQKQAYDRAVQAEAKRDQARDHALAVVALFPPPTPRSSAVPSIPPDGYVAADPGSNTTGPPESDVAPPVDPPPPAASPVPEPVKEAFDVLKDAQDAADRACSAAGNEGYPIGPVKVAPHPNPLCRKVDKKLPAALRPWLTPLGFSVDDFE